MIIAIDGYEANTNNRVGIGRYAYEMLVHLHALVAQGERDISVRVYLPGEPRHDMPKAGARWRYVVGGPARLWTFLGLPFRLFWDRPAADVVFSPTHYVPRATNIPRVMAIMDTSYLLFPGLFKPKDRHQLVNWTRYSVGVTRAIITISEFSRNAIMRAYRVPRSRVFVTYPGLSMPTKTTKHLSFADCTKKYAISKHFVLSVGTIQPRKNYIRLIEAYAQFLKKNKQKFSDPQLVIIGKKGWLYEDILKAPEAFGIADKVKFLDFVPDADLPVFYRNALCFVLPSLYEGFGLPVLEAMAYGCPVVVSNVSSLPEVAGAAGIYVDPQRPESIMKGLLTAVRQRNLLQGKKRIRMGLSQVKKFTWQAAAKQTLSVLESVGKGAL